MRRFFIIFALVLILFLGFGSVFYLWPSLFLDFQIYPQGLESHNKDIFLTVKIFPWKNFQLTNNQRYKSHLKWSLNKKHIAFFEDINISFDQETTLKIINPRTFQLKTIFIGDYHTSGYSWLNDETIRVYVNAGTGVRIYRDININIPKPFIASDFMSPEFWTPEKTF